MGKSWARIFGIPCYFSFTQKFLVGGGRQPVFLRGENWLPVNGILTEFRIEKQYEEMMKKK